MSHVLRSLEVQRRASWRPPVRQGRTVSNCLDSRPQGCLSPRVRVQFSKFAKTWVRLWQSLPCLTYAETARSSEHCSEPHVHVAFSCFLPGTCFFLTDPCSLVVLPPDNHLSVFPVCLQLQERQLNLFRISGPDFVQCECGRAMLLARLPDVPGVHTQGRNEQQVCTEQSHRT